MRTVTEVLDSHEIVVGRSGKILCPNHDDTNPSCSVKEEYVYCFTCLWSADAAGLEAKLTDRPIGEVLREWGPSADGRNRAERAKRPPELRHELWLDWVTHSQQYLTDARLMLAAWREEGNILPWQVDLIMRQVDFILDAANDVCHPRAEEDELPPHQVRAVLNDCKRMLLAWWSRNFPSERVL